MHLPETSSESRNQLSAILLVLLTLCAYIPAIYGGFIWDDDLYVTANRLHNDLTGLKQIWFWRNATPQYYPLIYTTFWLEFQLWGLWPAGYHIVNILLSCTRVMPSFCVEYCEFLLFPKLGSLQRCLHSIRPTLNLLLRFPSARIRYLVSFIFPLSSVTFASPARTHSVLTRKMFLGAIICSPSGFLLVLF